ncbi:HEAT repeat domain-containing protein [Polyangium aurulentum]|uniref:HEAT repeat domain-containing protein n=1 Tax=Polyangium aurulentum TaxID=2567896 RepID=UPI0010ADDEB3|nr:HEAT repeat domain-containing protein [Polyangium aurulentum]UQA57722.1 HEAT repeat domain-containing protein [Polyangium aurulentum]
MFRARLSGPPGALLLALVLLLAAALASVSFEVKAHTIPGGLTLLQLCRAADVVAIARIGKPPAEPKGGGALPPVEAEISELLRGGAAMKPGKIRFLPHRHAEETYREGEEVLLFLQHASRIGDESAAYQAVEAVADRIVLEPSSRKTWIDATRSYVALGKEGNDPAALGRVTLSMLASPEPRLSSFALRDLVLAGPLPVVTAADVPALEAIVNDGGRPISLRVGLLLEMERRKLVEVGSRWVPLLRGAAPADRVAVIRAAGSRSFHPPVTAELVTLVGSPEGDVAAAAARAVGAEGNEAAVEALGRAVNSDKPEVRWAALGSLRRIGTPAARALLERAASSHPDPETQRVAQTESRLLGPGSSASKGPQAGEREDSSASRRWKTWTLVVLATIVALVALGLRLFRRGADR